MRVGSLRILIRHFPRFYEETNTSSFMVTLKNMLQDILISFLTFLRFSPKNLLGRSMCSPLRLLLEQFEFLKNQYRNLSLATLCKLLLTDYRLGSLSLYRCGVVLKIDTSQRLLDLPLYLLEIESHCTQFLSRWMIKDSKILNRLNVGFCVNGFPLIPVLSFSSLSFPLTRKMMSFPNVSQDVYEEFLQLPLWLSRCHPLSDYRFQIMSQESRHIILERSIMLSAVS